MLIRNALPLVLLVCVQLGCRTGINYAGIDGPRFAGHGAGAMPHDSAGPLRVVSFNIKYAMRVDSAIALLTNEQSLRGADLLLLQEMDEAGTQQIADTLRMSYVYYPATYHLKNKKHFGNAVLSRWPIVADEKIVLPHIARFARTQRIATAATVRVRDTLVRVYSVHLGTLMEVGPGARREQLSAVVANAAPFEHVVIGGDLNNHGVGNVARDSGYSWVTEHGPRTVLIGRFDHLFLRGFANGTSVSSGTVLEVRSSSDHRPVWATAVLK